jgi:hypothetical protein
VSRGKVFADETNRDHASSHVSSPLPPALRLLETVREQAAVAGTIVASFDDGIVGLLR